MKPLLLLIVPTIIFFLSFILWIIYFKSINEIFKLEYLRAVYSQKDREKWKQKENNFSRIIYFFINLLKTINIVFVIIVIILWFT